MTTPKEATRSDVGGQVDEDHPWRMRTRMKVKKHCNNCGIPTNQEILHREVTRWSQDLDFDLAIDGGDEFILLKCMGCDRVSLAHESWCSENTSAGGSPIVTEARYPPAASRSFPSWINKAKGGAPTRIGEFLKEIYVALHNGSYRLCAIGIRALLEDIMVNKVKDQGSIGKNVDAFIQAGFVASQSTGEFRNRVLEAGHAAMHRGYSPSEENVVALLDITESIIAAIYVHPKQLKRLGGSIPRRRRPKKTIKSSASKPS